MKFFARNNRQGKVGIELDPYGLAVASLRPGADSARLQCRADYLEGISIQASGQALRVLVRAHVLERLPCSVVLHPSYYNLHLVQRPDVEDHEVGDAVKWTLKDQLDSSLDDYVVDAFPVPEDAFSNSQRMVYAVAARRDMLESVTAVVKAARLKLEKIQIAELANTNIVDMAEKEAGSTALLRLRKSAGSIVLSDHGDIYLARYLDQGMAMLEGADLETQYRVMDELLLDIQRSLDYYDSQLRKGRVRNFLMAPTQIVSERITHFLQDNLNVRVSVLDLNELFDTGEGLPADLQSVCFGAIGAAAEEIVH
ncbi:MAG: hypothetical protein KDI36_05795 [Pseudomonadales bacterium]|nr:hypothetical protein [Pseudomonadales bacterium]